MPSDSSSSDIHILKPSKEEKKSTAELTNNVVTIVRCSSSKVRKIGALWDASRLYCYLCRHVAAGMAQIYFRDAEIAIANAIKANPNMTEKELRKKVELEIDFAYQRCISSLGLE